MIDRYTLEFERSIYNFRLGGETADIEPISNALKVGLDHDMQVLMPVDPPEVVLNLIDPNTGKAPETFISESDQTLNLKHIEVGDGKFMIPVFTNEDELEKGDYPDVIVDSMKRLVDTIKFWDDCQGIVVNPWNLTLNLEKDLLEILLERSPGSHVEIVKGSVTNMHVGAIVNAANKTLLGGGGVDGAIHRLAGPMLKEECRLFGGCETGDAVITGAYNIDYVDAIIHTVGPVYRGNPEDRLRLAECYINSMSAAYENGMSSIAFPCISTGVYGYPLDEAAKVSLLALADWFKEHEDAVMNVYICCYRDEEYKAYMK